MAFEDDDIENGVQLATRIYQSGFVDEDSADVRYKNFQNEIFSLRYLLETLQQALRDAHERYLDRRQTYGLPAFEPRSQASENERKVFLGDFSGTLRACGAILEENKKIRLRYNDDLEATSWRLNQQDQRVNNLRSRIRLHTEKIRVAVHILSSERFIDSSPRSNSLLTVAAQHHQGSGDLLQDLSRHVAEHRSLHEVPPKDSQPIIRSVESRFESLMDIDASTGTDSDTFLIRGYDALLLAFQQSSQGTDQTPEKYVNFLKARWMLKRLKASRGYRTACTGFYFKRGIDQIEEKIVTRIAEPGALLPYDERVLIGLPDSCFHVWPPSTPATVPLGDPPDTLAARANEQKLIRANLASGKGDTVTVFKSSEKRFRIVVQTASGASQFAKTIIPQTVHSFEDNLVPRYCLPTLVEESPEMAIFSRGEETLYKFSSFQDLYNFQTALTGHEVSHDQNNVRCQFSDDVASLDCSGRLQLWQEPILLPNVTGDSSSERSPSLHTQASFVDRSHSRRDSVAPSVAPTNTVTWTAEGFEADTIKLPSLVIFTHLTNKKKESRFAIICIALERDIYIDPNECKCCTDYKACSKLVLTRRKTKDFELRVLQADIDSSGLPDSNTFDLFPFRRQHGGMSSNVATKRTEYLVLKFRSLQEKQQFHKELDLRFRVRDKQIEEQRSFTRNIRHREGRPSSRQQFPSHSPTYSPHSPALEPSLPPILDVPDVGPALGETLVANQGSVPNQRGHRNQNGALSPVIPTPRSMSSTRTAQSQCTSLDSMVLSNGDVEKIDVYLADELKRTHMVNTTSIHSSNYVVTPLQEHREFYGTPVSREASPIARSPSSAAPERYNGTFSNIEIHEAPDHHAILSPPPLRQYNAPPFPRVLDEKVYEAPEGNTIFALPRSQSAMAPEPYSPDDMNVFNDKRLYNRTQHEPTGLGLRPIHDDHSYMQTEFIVSRSRTGKPKSNPFRKFWQKS